MGHVNCAINRNHETRQLYVTTKVGEDFWRIPVYVCVDKDCMTKRGAAPLATTVGGLE